MGENNLTFEEALAGLEQSVADMTKPDMKLDEAMSSFEKGMDYYNRCSEMLNMAGQKISVCAGGADNDEKR